MLSDQTFLTGAVAASVVILARGILLFSDDLALTLTKLVLNVGGTGGVRAGRRKLARTSLSILSISPSIATDTSAIIHDERLSILLAWKLLLNDLWGVAGKAIRAGEQLTLGLSCAIMSILIFVKVSINVVLFILNRDDP